MTMTLLRDPDLRTTRPDRRRRSFTTEWIVGVAGAAVAALGLWIRYGFDAEVAEAWPFSAIIAGSLMLFTAFDRAAQKLTTPTGKPATWVALAALASLAAAVVFTLIWLL
jgi:hypothetical protein